MRSLTAELLGELLEERPPPAVTNCPDCGGTGDDGSFRNCPNCNGSGKIPAPTCTGLGNR